MNFEELIESINLVHNELQKKAVSAINKSLTIRNWIIGYYVVEFEQIGILLCTNMNNSLVEYATMGIANQLFVSKYQLALPTKEELQKFINDEMEKREIQ